MITELINGIKQGDYVRMLPAGKTTWKVVRDPSYSKEDDLHASWKGGMWSVKLQSLTTGKEMTWAYRFDQRFEMVEIDPDLERIEVTLTRGAWKDLLGWADEGTNAASSDAVQVLFQSVDTITKALDV